MGYLFWNTSRNSRHWLRHSHTNPTRTITGCPTSDINHNAGWLRNPDGTSIASLYAYYGSGPALSNTNCITQHAFLKWDIHSSSVSIQPEDLIGNFDGVDSSCIAYGWAYDPDRGSNDDGANDYDDDGDGFRSNALGNYTPIKVYSNGIYKGTFISQVYRCDPMNAGLAEDCYHGFQINLNSILSAGIQTVVMKGLEFPGNTTETNLYGSVEVNVGNCSLPEVSPNGSVNPLTIEKNPSSSTGFYIYFGKTINAKGYSLYEGHIGNYYDHGNTPNFCNISFSLSSGNRLKHELNPSTGNHYYLITAYSANQESVSGYATSGQIPASQSTCPP